MTAAGRHRPTGRRHRRVVGHRRRHRGRGGAGAAPPSASAPAGRTASTRCSSGAASTCRGACGSSTSPTSTGIDDVRRRGHRGARGGVDVLVNNAGVPKRRSDHDHDRRRRRGRHGDELLLAGAPHPRRCCPACWSADHGDIVNVSSMGVHMVAYGVGAYSASKAALEMFTESLYVELAGTGVRAHLFVPGTTATEFSTPKDGNDPPFPPDPATRPRPRRSAAAIVACVDERPVRDVRHRPRRRHVGDEGRRPERVPRRDARAPRRIAAVSPGRSAGAGRGRRSGRRPCAGG